MSEPAASIASQADYDECRRVMRGASKNYSFSARLLPADKRHHVEALYALLRVGDDRVDVSHDGWGSPLEAIDDWETTYWRAFESGATPNPVMRAYLATATEVGIPSSVMANYFRAMRDDLTVLRFPTFADLFHYMEGSAIPVGRAMTHILGVRPNFSFDEAIERADCLSVAMQLSNFCRDVGEDFRIGRIYIPSEELERFGVGESTIAESRIDSDFIALMEHQITRAYEFYARAREGVPMLASGRAGVMAALLIYEAILPSIRRNRYNVFTQRARSPLPAKLRLAAQAIWSSRLVE